ncbi:MAG: choice-of-anchor Q domain-containing protein [Burkholderiales bacterium]
MLPAGTYVLTRPPSGSDGDDSGDLNLTTPASGNPVITIAGAGAATTIIDANQIDGVLFIDLSRTAIISNVTIRGGYTAYYGGGVENRGALTLDRVSVTQNHNGDLGGGIRNSGSLVLRNSSLIDNDSSLGGGGLFNDQDAYVSASTFAFNTAYEGGGIYNYRRLILIDSTIALNEALTDGGGILGVEDSDSATNIYSSTIVFNDADEDRDGVGSGGGVHILAGNASTGFNLRNTLVTGNTYANSPQTDDCYTDSGAALDSYGVNLIGSSDGCTISTVTGFWDYFSGSLGGLQNNGGPTDTVALLNLGYNNAIDAGAYPEGCTDDQGNTILTDQRGFARTAGAWCDVGAYEFDPDRIFINGFD